MIGTAALPLALVAALTGCGAHPAPDRGTISGTFVAVGGPVPVNGRSAPPLPLPGRIVAIAAPASASRWWSAGAGRSGSPCHQAVTGWSASARVSRPACPGCSAAPSTLNG